jgi:hypothetical protein
MAKNIENRNVTIIGTGPSEQVGLPFTMAGNRSIEERERDAVRMELLVAHTHVVKRRHGQRRPKGTEAVWK